MNRAWSLGVWVVAAVAAGCSSSDPGQEPNCEGPDCEPVCEGTECEPTCEGAECEPMLGASGHPLCTENSPAGMPCEDGFGAITCPKSSEYDGDEYALCDQGEDVGLMFHYGPRDYDDPENVALFTLPPGGEDENCTYAYSRNDTDRFVKSYRGRMRPNSHHLILRTESDATFAETDLPQPCDFTQLVDGRWLVGSQDPQIDIAIGGGTLGTAAGDTIPEPGDPDFGLAQRIVANTPVQIDLHYTNPTDETILREAWVWFDYVEEGEVEDLVDMITFFQGEIDIPPNSTYTTQRGYCVAPTDRYVGLLTGHAHETLTRFSVWHATGAEEKLVYETYDWADPGNLFYRDGLPNPAPNPEAFTHGGSSGYLFVKAGESISFECEYKNPSSQSIGLGETTNDEMCNVFGMYYPTDGDVWSCVCLGGCFNE